LPSTDPDDESYYHYRVLSSSPADIPGKIVLEVELWDGITPGDLPLGR
jgi:hypothetical protein